MPSFSSRLHKKFWSVVRNEYWWISQYGDLRMRERYGLIERASYFYGMLRAADVAKYFEKKKVTVVEFGVAGGNGLLNMIALAPMIQAETGVEFRIVGFDTGKGLPSVKDYRDHPEIWNPGDFSPEDRDEVQRKIGNRAEMFWGDIADTVDGFVASIDPSAPLGFVSVDVDIYSATRSALRCLTGAADKYNPTVSMYFDDVSFFFTSEWTGELLAIREFNDEQTMRKIGKDRSIDRRPVTPHSLWHSAMYACQVLDHEARQQSRERGKLTIREHMEFLSAQNAI